MTTYALPHLPDAAVSAARAAAWAYLQDGPLDDLLAEAAHAPLRALALPLQARWSVGHHSQVTLDGTLTLPHLTRARMITAQPGCLWADALQGALSAVQTLTGPVTLRTDGLRTLVSGTPEPDVTVHALVEAVIRTCTAHLETTHAQLHSGGPALLSAAERFGWRFDRRGALVQVAPPLTLFADPVAAAAPTLHAADRPRSLFEEM